VSNKEFPIKLIHSPQSIKILDKLTTPIPSKANNAVPKNRGNSLNGALAGNFPGSCRLKKRYWYVPVRPKQHKRFAAVEMYAMNFSFWMNARERTGNKRSTIQILTSNKPNN